MPAHIRPIRPEDRPAISRICLLTGRAGQSAEPDHTISGMPGYVFAEPYAASELQPDARTFGFVLVDDESDVAVGYIIGTADTRTYERVAEERWWPPLRERYPLASMDDPSLNLKEADRIYFKTIHEPDPAPDTVVEFSPAHMHINLLPSYQRQGWGRRLINAAVTHLKGEGIDAVHLGIDPRNDDARQFYLKVGFEKLRVDHAEWYGLKFSRFTPPR